MIRLSYSTKRASDPGSQKDDIYSKLKQNEQVVIFRLRTGHNKLKYHLFSRLQIGDTHEWNCTTGKVSDTHVLEECPM